MLKIICALLFTPAFLFFHQDVFAAISFSIANPQTNGEEITFDVSLSGLTSSSCPNVSCYLQAAFTSQSQPKYFGFIKNNGGEWYSYDGSPEQDFIKSTFFSFEPQAGNWSGQLTIKVDPEDSDYNGPGNYDIKAWRYSGNSSNYSGASDNILTVQLTTSLPSPSPSPTPESQSVPSPSPTPTKAPSPSPTPAKSPTPIPKQQSPSPKTSPQNSPLVLGLKEENSSPSPSPTPEGEQGQSTLKVAGILTGAGAILIALSIGFYLWYSKVFNKPKNIQENSNESSTSGS